MTNRNDAETLAALQARIHAQEKTIAVLMDTVERQSAAGASTLELLSHNLGLEKVVQRKTERLRQQGEELHNTLRELQLTQAQLLQANKLESVGQLAAGIAHEINTPAQFIGTNVDFLHDAFTDVQMMIETVIKQVDALSCGEPENGLHSTIATLLAEIDWDYLSEEIPSAIRQSQDGIKRITSIVQAMKEFSHPSSKEKVKNDLNRLLETTITVATNEWKYCAEVTTELDPQLPVVCCLADELGQVFLNILVNAAHAIEKRISSETPRKKGHISISTRQVEDAVEISITDDGCGIAPEIQGRIFDPFFTTKGVGKGTGQGLAIAHDVITKKHEGTITVDSEAGKGSRFVVRIPLE